MKFINFFASLAFVCTADHTWGQLDDSHRAISTPWYHENQNKYTNWHGRACRGYIPARVVITTGAGWETPTLVDLARTGAYYVNLKKLQDESAATRQLALVRLGHLKQKECINYDFGQPGEESNLEEAASHAYNMPVTEVMQTAPMSEMLTWMSSVGNKWFPEEQIDGVEPLRLAVISPTTRDLSHNYVVYWTQEEGVLCHTYNNVRFSFLGPLMQSEMEKTGIRGLVIPTDVAFAELIEWWHWAVRTQWQVSDSYVRVVGIPKEYVNNGTYYDRMVDIIRDNLCWMEHERLQHKEC